MAARDRGGSIPPTGPRNHLMRPAFDDPNAPCYMRGHQRHTNAACWTQHPHLRVHDRYHPASRSTNSYRPPSRSVDLHVPPASAFGRNRLDPPRRQSIGSYSGPTYSHSREPSAPPHLIAASNSRQPLPVRNKRSRTPPATKLEAIPKEEASRVEKHGALVLLPFYFK